MRTRASWASDERAVGVARTEGEMPFRASRRSDRRKIASVKRHTSFPARNGRELAHHGQSTTIKSRRREESMELDRFEADSLEKYQRSAFEQHRTAVCSSDHSQVGRQPRVGRTFLMLFIRTA